MCFLLGSMIKTNFYFYFYLALHLRCTVHLHHVCYCAPRAVRHMSGVFYLPYTSPYPIRKKGNETGFLLSCSFDFFGLISSLGPTHLPHSPRGKRTVIPKNRFLCHSCLGSWRGCIGPLMQSLDRFTSYLSLTKMIEQSLSSSLPTVRIVQICENETCLYSGLVLCVVRNLYHFFEKMS